MNLSITKCSIECVKNWYDKNSFFKRECLPRVLLIVMGPLSSIGEVFYQLAQFNPSGAKSALANCVMIPLRGFYNPESCLNHYLDSRTEEPEVKNVDSNVASDQIVEKDTGSTDAATPIASPPPPTSPPKSRFKLLPASDSQFKITSSTPDKKAENLKAKNQTTIESYRPHGDQYVLDESGLPEQEKEFLRIRRELLNNLGDATEVLEQLKADFSNPNKIVKGLSKEAIANLYWENVAKMQELATHVVNSVPKKGRRIFEEQEEDSNLEDIHEETPKISPPPYQSPNVTTTAGGNAVSLSDEGKDSVNVFLNKVQNIESGGDSEDEADWSEDTGSSCETEPKEDRTESVKEASKMTSQNENVVQESVKNRAARFGDQLIAKLTSGIRN